MQSLSTQNLQLGSGVLTATGNNLYLNSVPVGGGTTITGYASGNTLGLYIPQVTNMFSGITNTLNWQVSDHFDILLTGNTNIFFTGTQQAMTIIVASHDTGAGYNITFPTTNGNNFSGINWVGGTGAIPVQTSGGTDIYTFTQFNTGIYVSYVQGF